MKRTRESEPETRPVVDVTAPQTIQSSHKLPAEPHLEPLQLIAGCGNSVGKQREHNEDSLFTLSTVIATDSILLPFGLYIIADGMGGHQYGEVASATALKAMAGHIIKELYLPLFSLKNQVPVHSLQEVMQEGVTKAQEAILDKVLGGGTTLTAVSIIGEQMTIAHVGDSRAFLLHPDGRMEALTRDHSLVKRLEELGQITAEEAANHPQRNVLYRAIGQGEPYEPDIISSRTPHDAYLMVCSDGLWGVVDEQQIFEIVASSPSPHLACQSLIEAANNAGGPDNISVILVRLPA